MRWENLAVTDCLSRSVLHGFNVLSLLPLRLYCECLDTILCDSKLMGTMGLMVEFLAGGYPTIP